MPSVAYGKKSKKANTRKIKENRRNERKKDGSACLKCARAGVVCPTGT